MEQSFYLCGKDECVLYLSCCKSSLPSCIHPPYTHFSIHSFALLYLPLVCAVPSLPSPSLSPPARSFPRTACSQPPLSDWLIGIKGPVALPSTWLNSIFATALSSFPPLLGGSRCLPHARIAAHMCMQQCGRHSADIRCWHVHARALNQVGAACCAVCVYQADKECLPVNTPTHTGYEKGKKKLDPWQQSASFVWTKPTLSVMKSERDTLWRPKTQSTQLQSSWSSCIRQNGPHSDYV